MPASAEAEYGRLFLAAYDGDAAALAELLTRYDTTFRRLIRAHLSDRVRSVADSEDCVAMLWEDIFVFKRRDWRLIEPAKLLPYFRQMARNLARNMNSKYLDVAKRTLLREKHFSEMPTNWNI